MYDERKKTSGISAIRGMFVWALVVAVMAAITVGGAEQGPVRAGESAESAEMSSPAVDVAEPVPTPAAVGSDPASGSTPAATGTEAAPGGRIQSITFKKDMQVQDALQFLAARYQKNIVPSSKIDGAITVTNLYDVTFEQALDAILGYGFKHEEQGNFINVYTAAEYKTLKEDPERMVYEIFTLYYISAAEAKKMITPILSANARVEVTTAAETAFPTGDSISTVSGGGDTTAMNDTMILHDYPENIEEAAKVLREVDIRPKQVLIEATIMSVTLTEGMQFGIDWQTLKGSAVSNLSSITAGAEDYLKSVGTGATVGTSSLSGGLTVGFALGDVGAFIRAAEEMSDVTILANPKILAINKQLGQVYIGKKIGYKTQTTQTQTSTTEQIGFLDTGTKLSFRPYIGNDGYIRMDIHPKDSSGELKTSDNLPEESSAELVTNILVKDGQTIVIGGLFRDKISTVRTQVPVLGDIPIIGLLFRGKADEIRREEVVVLLTPHIINEPSQTDGDGRAEDVRRKRQGAKDELQWTGRGRRAEDYYASAVKLHAEGDNDAAMEQVDKALRLRPAYLEAIRLKERILRRTDPEAAKQLERIMLEALDRQEAPKWLRR